MPRVTELEAHDNERRARAPNLRAAQFDAAAIERARAFLTRATTYKLTAR